MTINSSSCIETVAVEFSHNADDRTNSCAKALDGISVSIAKGEFIALLGRNGSGKTTFARLLNALILPTKGIVCIHGINTRNKELVWDVRRLVGMVFQDPDSQIIGTTVEEDVAFGPENLGLSPEVITSRVRDALEAVVMTNHTLTAPHLLSGGEKQKVSLAGILAMHPECIVLDEVTAMLDPENRKEVLSLVRRLNKAKGITVLHITHDMEEACFADRIIVLDAGKVVLDGTPGEVFSGRSEIKAAGLELPQIAELFSLLNMEGLNLPGSVPDIDVALEALATRINPPRGQHVHQN